MVISLTTLHSPLFTFLGWLMGFEPTHAGATILCLNRLTTATIKIYLHLADSLMARLGGLEPPTHGLEVRCSIH